MSNQTGGLPTVRSSSRKGRGKAASAAPGGRDVDLPALNLGGGGGDDGGGGSGGGGGGAVNVPTEMPPTPRRRDVETMPSFEIMEHLRKRNCVPTGFYEDDKAKLQLLFDEDYEKQKATRQAYLAHVNANRKANYTREFAERKQQRDVMEISTAIKNNPRVPVWLDLVKAGRCAPYASWNGVKRPLVRHISTQLPVQSNLVGLEFCRCGINDEICGFVANMLLSNRSLRQLNLSENHIGAAGLAALAKALEVNDVLRFIGLQGNPLRASADSSDNQPSDWGVNAMAEMLKVNNTLVRLDLLNTGLGPSSFELLGDALRRNTSVLILDADAALAALSDARNIKLALASNQHRQKLEAAKKKKTRLVEKKVELQEEAVVEERHEQKRVMEWIETARRRRIQDRKHILQEERERQLAEEEQRRAAARAAMEAAMASAGKKKKKKGKGKGKKKKKK